MDNLLNDVCLARLPRSSLTALASLRCKGGVTVHEDGDLVFLRWTAGDEETLQRILPLDGVELFSRQEDQWYRLGRRLPAFDVGPLKEGVPLERVLFPAKVEAEPPRPPELVPVTLTLVRDVTVHPTTALLTSHEALQSWANRATTLEFEDVSAARSGDRILLLGRSLPILPKGQRLWGKNVLIPLGWRTEPALPEPALMAALEVDAADFLILNHHSAEVVPSSALQSLSRGAVRLLKAESA